MLFPLNTVEINRMEVTWGTNTEQGGVAQGTAAGLKPDPGYGAEGKRQILWRSFIRMKRCQNAPAV